jgi:hypothetical protein
MIVTLKLSLVSSSGVPKFLHAFTPSQLPPEIITPLADLQAELPTQLVPITLSIKASLQLSAPLQLPSLQT